MMDLDKLETMQVAAALALPVMHDGIGSIHSKDNKFALYDEGGANADQTDYVIALVNAAPELFSLIRKQEAALADLHVAEVVAGAAIDQAERSKRIAAVLSVVQQDYSPECLRMASTSDYVADAIGQLIDAGLLDAPQQHAQAAQPTSHECDYQLHAASGIWLCKECGKPKGMQFHHIGKPEPIPLDAGIAIMKTGLQSTREAVLAYNSMEDAVHAPKAGYRVPGNAQAAQPNKQYGLAAYAQANADSRLTVPAQAALSDEQRAVIDEAAKVLESAAAHNRSKSRTVLAHAQQDRADRLRLAFATRQPAPVAPPEFSRDPDGDLCLDWSGLSVSFSKTGMVSWAVEGASGSERVAPAILPAIPTDDMCRAVREKTGIGSNIADHVWRIMVAEFSGQAAPVAAAVQGDALAASKPRQCCGSAEFCNRDVCPADTALSHEDAAPVDASTDPIVELNVTMLRQRSAVGVKKYGVTMADSGLDLRAWLAHALEEGLDQVNYLQAAMQKLNNQGG